MPANVLAISGSPSPTSKTALLADHVLAKVAAQGAAVEHIRLRDLDPAALLTGKLDNEGLAKLGERLSAADGVVVATPVFKAAYSGLLKAALDVMPQYALVGKVVLPVATGGSVAHVLAMDYSLRPMLQSMGARHIVQSFFLSEQSVRAGADTFAIDDAAAELLDCAVRDFMHSLAAVEPGSGLGHPKVL